MILVDTGPIVAVVNDRDDRHQECKYLLDRLPGLHSFDTSVLINGRRDLLPPEIFRTPFGLLA